MRFFTELKGLLSGDCWGLFFLFYDERFDGEGIATSGRDGLMDDGGCYTCGSEV